MSLNIEKMRSDMKWENRKFAVSIFVAFAAVAAASVAIGNYLGSRPLLPPPPQTIIIQQQPAPK